MTRASATLGIAGFIAMVGAAMLVVSPVLAADEPKTVTVGNFVRAETDFYFKTREFGKLNHSRTMAAIDKQDVVRMNRDTLYSSGIFDLDAAPVTIALPDPGKRFMSMQVISEDHYTVEVVYAPGSSLTQGTRSGRAMSSCWSARLPIPRTRRT
ncbi:hypothetical protein FHS21_003115 [Phyllobacterium trifolii]|uniref:DUF1254 domain-containing protein n=1 Tax=Phyllobacterium trifolii TaxID=300193 RepID=A0A839UE62_9HYPH|nr:DUF1254 domain-containing protein [Phyllobacterium trifolii]MBB3146699.1 hypothetical protein [Phyllobacterium trifolii]